MNGCFLCLEYNLDTLEGIEYNSGKWHELEIQSLIDKHLWWPLGHQVIDNTFWICKQCWLNLFTFHQFYLRVKEAQEKLLPRITVKKEICANSKKNSNFSKTGESSRGENDVETIKSSNQLVQIKRPRGRPRKHEKLNPIIEELIVSDMKPGVEKTQKINETERCGKEVDNSNVLVADWVSSDSDLKSLEKAKYLREKKKKLECTKSSKEIILNKRPRGRPRKYQKANLEIKELSVPDVKHEFETVQTTEEPKMSRVLENPNETIVDWEYCNSDLKPLATLILEEQNNITQHEIEESQTTDKAKMCKTLLDNSGESIVDKEAKMCEDILGNSNKSVIDMEYSDSDLKPLSNLFSKKYKVGSQKKKLSRSHRKNVSSLKNDLIRQNDEFISANFKLSCCICEEPLDDFPSLKTHFRIEHKTRGYVLCCGKKLNKRGVLVDHIRMHQDPEFFKCKRCNKVMANRRCLEIHMQGHEDKRERIYHCEQCGKSFYRRSVFTRHVLLHVPDDQKKIACPQCDKTFATNYIMTQHLRLVHLNKYVNICDICGKSVRGRDAFHRHLGEHAGVPRATIQCDVCGAVLTNKYGLARHKKMMHMEENQQEQVCKICSKVSPNIGAHKRHVQYMHGMKRKHACPMCEKAFKRPKELREHMTIHTGEVLYTCPHCPKTFNSNANMHSHRKKAHRKEWEERRRQKYPGAQLLNVQQTIETYVEPIQIHSKISVVD